MYCTFWISRGSSNWHTFLLLPYMYNHFEAVDIWFHFFFKFLVGLFKGNLGNGNRNLKLIVFVGDNWWFNSLQNNLECTDINTLLMYNNMKDLKVKLSLKNRATSYVPAQIPSQCFIKHCCEWVHTQTNTSSLFKQGFNMWFWSWSLIFGDLLGPKYMCLYSVVLIILLVMFVDIVF